MTAPIAVLTPRKPQLHAALAPRDLQLQIASWFGIYCFRDCGTAIDIAKIHYKSSGNGPGERDLQEGEIPCLFSLTNKVGRCPKNDPFIAGLPVSDQVDA